MKHFFIAFSVALMTVSSSWAQQNFTLQGTVDKNLNHQKYYVFLSDADYKFGEQPSDSILVRKGKFKYTATLTDARPVKLSTPDGSYAMSFFFVPDESCKLTVKSAEYLLDGSTFYQQYRRLDDLNTAYVRDIQSLIQRADSMKKALPADQQKDMQQRIITDAQQIASGFKANSMQYIGEEGAVAFLASNGQNIEEIYSKTTDEVRNGRLSAYLNKKMADLKARKEAAAKAQAEAKAALDKSGEGQKFIDFQAEYQGKVTRLSDYVGKGKYVLVDFWASWCGPCKAEIPNIIKCYDAHKGDKFEVLGVATWDKPEDTLKAMESLGIKYPQMLNAQKAGSDAYGIMGIPQIILFGPDGTILKRDLRGEAIEATVSEYLSK